MVKRKNLQNEVPFQERDVPLHVTGSEAVISRGGGDCEGDSSGGS